MSTTNDPTTEPSIEVAPNLIQLEGPDVAFETATYYDHNDDAERLNWESPEEALEQWLVDEFDPDEEPAVACIERLSPITIFAWQRREFSDSLIKGYAEEALDHVLERLGENEVEYFDPDGEGPDISAEHKRSLMPEAIALITKLLGHVHVWGCEQVASRTYTAGQVEAMMRDHCPSWFKVES